MRTAQLILITITGILVATVTSQNIVELPDFVYAEKEDNITLTCEFSNPGSSVARFTWYHDDSLVAFDRSITVVDVDRSKRYSLETDNARQRLSIQKVIYSDGGEWRCDPSIGVNTFQTNTHLVVKVSPSLANRTQQEKWTPQVGSSLELYCNASGNPTPTVTWSRETGAGIILPDGTKTEYFIGNSLKFVNVSERHHGKYTCRASNGLKNGARAEYSVNVPFPPDVIVGTSSVRAPRNRMFEIGCIVKSFPKITDLSQVVWKKNEVIISNNQNGYEYSVIEGTDDDTAKSILSLPKVDNTVVGEYTCEFTNSRGSKSATIMVEAGPNINPETGATTSGIVLVSAMAYLNLAMLFVFGFVHFKW